MEVLEKIYWSILTFLLYVIMGLLFTIIFIGAWIREMFDKYFIKFLEAIDNTFAKIHNWFTAPRCKCNLKKKDKK
jgi:hypothetical protein